jgi:hypothetical protein
MILRKKSLLFCLLLACTAFSPSTFAQFDDDVTADDTYDPFADYSEFEASADEEADIHFFKNGRFFNFAFLFGGRMWTQTLGELYSPGAVYGAYMTYFFDLRTALQVSFLHGEHAFKLEEGTTADGPYAGFSGNVAMTTITADMKYYFNTANITRGFADLNPYVIGGFSMNYRTISIAEEDVLVKSSPTGVQLGLGLEIPIARNKMYMGFQFTYHLVNFPDENEQIIAEDENPTNVYPKGDYAQGLFILGINF